MLSEWLLGLGEFETGEFDGDAQENYNVYNQYSLPVTRLLWIYFLAGTLLTQIILMNTLIAILGDTYEKITEKKQLYSITQRTKLYANFVQNIKFDSVVDQKYFVVVRPLPDEDDNQWEGAITSLKSKMKKNQEHMSRELRNLQSEILKGQKTVISELRAGQ